MQNETVISRNNEWLTARIDDDLVMMHVGSPVYLNLSGAGGRIWELLERPRSIADLCNALAREFDILPEAARPEVVAFLERLLERKAIDVHPAAME